MSQRQMWMWANACELLSQAERLQQQFFRLAANAPSWEPPIDLIEDGVQLQLIIALPGVAPEHIRLRLGDGSVHVEAIRRGSVGSCAATVRRLEIPFGRFARRINLPPGFYQLREQAFENGCLSLNFVRHDREQT